MHISKRTSFNLLALVLTVGSLWWAIAYFHPRQIAADLLNLDALPRSAKQVKCNAWGITDVETLCRLEVSQGDFQALTTGWPFESRACSVQVHQYGSNPVVGTDFLAAWCLETPAAQFPAGGWVKVYADALQQHVLVETYIE